MSEYLKNELMLLSNNPAEIGPLAKPRSDQIGSDRQNPDRINNKFKVPAKGRLMKLLRTRDYSIKS